MRNRLRKQKKKRRRLVNMANEIGEDGQMLVGNALPTDTTKEKEIDFAEADRMDELESKYFKPKLNIEYRLTFSSWRLVRKLIPDYKDKTKMNERTVLELKIESRSDSPVEQEWGILAKTCRDAFSAHCKNGNITKKIFSFKAVGTNKAERYEISEVGDKDKPASPIEATV